MPLQLTKPCNLLHNKPMKKLLISGLICAVVIGYSACTKSAIEKSNPGQPADAAENPPPQPPVPKAAGEKVSLKKCAAEKVQLPGYGDPGQQLSSCFVQYPGEATRHDKYYHIVEDVCGQFTKEFVENMLGISVLRVEPPKSGGVYNCRYYFSNEPAGIGEYIMLSLDYLSVDDQKKGHQLAGRTIKTDSRIKMEHFIVWQQDGLINEIYLVLSPQKFISINRSSGKMVDNEKDIEFAASLANEIKDYK